jgi:peptide/nickel transport system permease protein
MAVPWLVFALLFAPLYIRMVRTRLLDTLAERYVTTARAKGAGERRVVISHALPNATGPLLPMIALDAGTAIMAAIYIETIFGLPGLGFLAVQALSGEFFTFHYDLPFILALVFTIGLFVVVLSTLADIANAWLDPRLRERALS